MRGSRSASRARGPELSLGKRILFSVVTVIGLLLAMELSTRYLIRTFVGPGVVPKMFFGFRVPPKPPDTVRVFAFGGSTVFGGHLPKVGFVRQLEVLLQGRMGDKRIEVWNFGRSGRDSTYVREAIERTLRGSPDVIIVYSAHNEFLIRQPVAPLWLRLKGYVDRLGIVLILRDIKMEVSSRVMPRRILTFPAFRRDSELFARKVRIYEENLEAIVRTARVAGVPLVLCTATSNLLDWPPVRKEITGQPVADEYASLRDRLRALVATPGGAAEAEPLAAVLAARYPDEPMTDYLVGRQLALTGSEERALAHLIRAKDRDPIPSRALERFNDKIRALSRREGVFLADVDALFRERAPGGLVGFPRIMDNCHPDPEGNHWIALLLLDLLRRDVLPDRFDEGPAPLTLDETLEAIGVTVADRAYLLKKNAEYCLQPPFYNEEAARRFFAERDALLAR